MKCFLNIWFVLIEPWVYLLFDFFSFDQILVAVLKGQVICVFFPVNRSDFPLLSNQGSWGTKNTPVKATSGGSLSRQKSMGGRTAERTLSSSPASGQSSLKGKKDALTKHSGKNIVSLVSLFSNSVMVWHFLTFSTLPEAMDFRDWCESECVRIIGIKGIFYYFLVCHKINLLVSVEVEDQRIMLSSVVAASNSASFLLLGFLPIKNCKYKDG